MGQGYEAYIQSLRDRNAMTAQNWAQRTSDIGLLGNFLVPRKKAEAAPAKGKTAGGKSSGGTAGGTTAGETPVVDNTSPTSPNRYVAIEELSDSGEIHDEGFQDEMTSVELSTKADYDELKRDMERGYITKADYEVQKQDLDKRNPDLNPQLQGASFAPMEAEKAQTDESRKRELTNRTLISDRFARESLSTTRDFNFNMIKPDKIQGLSKVASLPGLVGELDTLRDRIAEYAITPTITQTRGAAEDLEGKSQYTKNEDNLKALQTSADSALTMIDKGIDNIELKLEGIAITPDNVAEIAKLKIAKNELEKHKDNISLLKKVNPNQSSVIGKVQVTMPEYLDNTVKSLEDISKDIDQTRAMAQIEAFKDQLLNGTDNVGPMNLRDKNSIKQHVNSDGYQFVMGGILGELESIRERRISGEEMTSAENRYINEKEDKLLMAYDNLKALQMAEPETNVDIKKQKKMIEDIDESYAQLKSMRELIPEDVKINIDEHPEYIAAKAELDAVNAEVQRANKRGEQLPSFLQTQLETKQDAFNEVEERLGKDEQGKTDYIRPITEITKEGSDLINDKEKSYYQKTIEQLKGESTKLKQEAAARKEIMSIPRNRAGELKLIIDKARSGGVISAKENKELKTIVSDMNDQINEENAALTKVMSVAQTIKPQTLKGEWGKYTPEETEIPADMKNYLVKRGIRIPNNLTNLSEFKDWAFGKMDANKKDKMLINKVGRFSENPEAMKENMEWVDRLMYLKRDFGTQAENATEEYGAITSKLVENDRKIKEISKGLSIADKNKSKFESETERLNNRIANKLEDLARTEVTKTKSSVSGMAYTVARKIEALTESRMEKASARDKTTSSYDALQSLNEMASSYADRMLNKYYEGARKEKDTGLIAPEATSTREMIEKRKEGIAESPEYRESIKNLGRERFLKVHPIGSIEWWKTIGLKEGQAKKDLTFEQKKELLEIDRTEKLALENAKSDNDLKRIKAEYAEKRNLVAFADKSDVIAKQWTTRTDELKKAIRAKKTDINNAIVSDINSSGVKIKAKSSGKDLDRTQRESFGAQLWANVNKELGTDKVLELTSKGTGTPAELAKLQTYDVDELYLTDNQIDNIMAGLEQSYAFENRKTFLETLKNLFRR